MSDLPDGWNWVKLAEIVHSLSNGRSVPDGPDTGYPVLRLTAIRSGFIDITASKKGDWTAESARQFRIRKGDYLVARGNGSKRLVGRGGMVREDAEVAFPDTMIRIRFDEARICPTYGALIWDAPSIRTQIERAARTSAGIYKVSQGDLREIQIPLPPIEDQKRVVAVAQEEISRLDAGVTALANAERNIKKLNDILPIQLLEFHASAGHELLTLGEISAQVVDCPHSTPKFSQEGPPCIDTTCISPGAINYDRIRHVNPSTYEERVRRLVPQHGDVVFAREGTVGTAVLIPPDLDPCLGQRVMLFRPNPHKVRGDYMCLMINSETVKRQYREKLLGSTVPHLNVRDAKKLLIPVPNLSIQAAIAMRADEIVSNLMFVRNVIRSSGLESSALRNSILEAALSGKLI